MAGIVAEARGESTTGLQRSLLIGSSGAKKPAMPEQKEEPIEERIGSAIGKIIFLALLAFLIWGYGSTLAGRLGLF
jgi:hypothetical protein